MSKKKVLHYRVRYGYKPLEFVRVSSVGDLERAVYAMVELIPVTLNGRIIHGKTILGIEPDFHAYTGWHATHIPTTGADEAQILRDAPPIQSFVEQLSGVRSFVGTMIERGTQEQIGQGESLKLLESKK